MYARVVVYAHDDDKDELEAKARAATSPSSPAPRGTSPTASCSTTTVWSRSASGSPRTTPRRRTPLSPPGSSANTTMKSESRSHRGPLVAGARPPVDSCLAPPTVTSCGRWRLRRRPSGPRTTRVRTHHRSSQPEPIGLLTLPSEASHLL